MRTGRPCHRCEVRGAATPDRGQGPGTDDGGQRLVRRFLIALAVIVVLIGASLAASSWVRGPSAAVPQAPAVSPAATDRLPAATAKSASVPAVPASPSTASASTAALTGLPDPHLTPGAINPNVRPDTLAGTICKSGWTKTVRPPSAYTSALKVVQIVEYGYADKNPRHYEEDHLVPLELGGAPRDPKNLWPEPRTASLPDGTPIGADEKDHLENALKRDVCDGTMALASAQRAIASDWVQAWIDAGRP